MREVRTEIEIRAATSKVWRILTEFDKWQEWNPIVKSAKGNAAIGSTLTITMCGKENSGKAGPKYMPHITHFNQPNFFRWRAKMLAGLLLTNDKVFELQETTEGTRLVHKELVSGLMAMLFWGKFKKMVPPMLNNMNHAVKRLAEQVS